MGLEKFRAKYNVSFLDFFGRVSSVKCCMLKKGVTFKSTHHLPEIKAYGLIVKACKGAKTFYDILQVLFPY